MTPKLKEAARIMTTVLNESVKAGHHQTAQSVVVSFDALNYLIGCATKGEEVPVSTISPAQSEPSTTIPLSAETEQ